MRGSLFVANIFVHFRVHGLLLFLVPNRTPKAYFVRVRGVISYDAAAATGIICVCSVWHCSARKIEMHNMYFVAETKRQEMKLFRVHTAPCHKRERRLAQDVLNVTSEHTPSPCCFQMINRLGSPWVSIGYRLPLPKSASSFENRG